MSRKLLVSEKKRSLSQSFTDVATYAALNCMDNLTEMVFPTTPIGIKDKPKLRRLSTVKPKIAAEMLREDAKQLEGSFASLLKLRLPRDPFISPVYADDNIIRQLPPTWFVVSFTIFLDL